MVCDREECSALFTRLADNIYVGKIASSVEADKAKKEFDVNMRKKNFGYEHKNAFLLYSYKEEKLDTFLTDTVSNANIL